MRSLRKPPLVERMPNVPGQQRVPREVMALVDSKRFHEARDCTADFLEQNPGHVMGHAVLIRIHGMLGETGVSEHLFNYCRRSGMDHRDIYCAMVDALANCEEYQRALGIIAWAAEAGRDDLRSYINFMSRLYGNGRYAEMEAFYFSIPQRHRETTAIKVRYADALRKMKRYGEAIEIAISSLRMHGTLNDRTDTKIIIGYSEMELGNYRKAYEVLHGIYAKISMRDDGGASLSFFPRLLCGMVFACSRGGIPQPHSTILRWRDLLEKMLEEKRGKTEDVQGALRCLDRIPIARAQHAL